MLEWTDDKVRDAALKWMATMTAGRGKRSLSPMDEMPFFQTPKMTYVVGSGGTAKQLILPNSMRVAILFGCNVQSGVAVAPDPKLAGNGIGFPVGNTSYPLTILQKDTGILCQSEWWGSWSTPVATISICEIILLRWPVVK